MDEYIWWGLVVLGVFLIGASISNISKAMRSRRWQHAPGEVLVSNVIEFGGSSEKTYSFEFRYRYDAHDGSHESQKLRFSPILQTQAAATALTEKYPKGRKIDVLYNPAKPTEAVVEPGGGLSLVVLPLCALCFLAAGMKMLGWFDAFL